jgi:hypothetical protein
MRYRLIVLLLVTLVCGCNSLPWGRPGAPVQGLRINSSTPTAGELVTALNDNAGRVRSLECRNVSLDCTQGRETVGLGGLLACEPQQRHFRMTAKAMGSTEVDLGSNEREFWFWIKRAPQPYLFYCSHEDFARGAAQMPFPFQPDWIVEALGIAPCDQNRNYQVVAHQGSFDLIEATTSPQGAPVRKVTRITRSQNRFIVSAHLLQDAEGRDICAAYVREVQQDRGSGAVLPRQVQLVWPSQQIRMKFVLEHVQVNAGLDQERVAALFSRPALRDVQAFDLARGQATGPVQQAGGTYR